MADPNVINYSDISSALASYFRDEIVATFNRACPEAAFITAKPGTGKNIQWDVKFGANVPGSGTFTDGAAVTAYRNEKRVPAIIQYANYYEPFGITGRAKAAAMAAGNPMQLVDLYRDELMDAVTRLAANLMDGFYNGAGTTDLLHGLYASGAPAIGDTGVYATINPATSGQEAWKGNVVDAATSPIALSHLRSLRRKVRDATGFSPDLYITDTGQFDAIAAIYDGNRRWVDEVTRADGAKVRIDGGTEMLSWEGASIIWSRAHPAQKVTGLTRSQIYWSQLPDGPDAVNRALGNIALAGTGDSQVGAPPFQLQALIQPLAIQGNAYPFALFMYPAVVVQRRNAHGYITGLAAA